MRKGHRSHGFTVVELVIAIVIMGFVVPAVALALNNLTTINYQARDLSLANTTAQGKIEALRSQGYNAVPAGTVNFSSELPSSMGSPKSASYTVTDGTAGGTPPTGVKQVDITISYTEFKSTQTVTYRSYIGELGVGQ